MISVFIILLLAVASAPAADPQKLPLTSAEQVASYFREAREHLLAPLPEESRRFVINVSTAAHGLVIKKWWTDDKRELLRDPKLQGNQSPIFGSLAAVEASKTDTWSLYYNAGMHAFVVYLDAVSGKVLYIYSIPEGNSPETPKQYGCRPHGIYRIIDAFRSPSPDPRRYLTKSMRFAFSALSLALSFACPINADESVISPFAESTKAPHGRGNLYAPDILKHRGEFLMVIESRDGAKWATSMDGIGWKSQGLLHPKDDDSPYGHVTPFLLIEEKSWRLFYGAARAKSWDQNSICSAVLKPPAPTDRTKK